MNNLLHCKIFVNFCRNMQDIQMQDYYCILRGTMDRRTLQKLNIFS